MAVGNLVIHLLIGIPVFFLIKWLLKGKAANEKNRNLWALGGTLIAAPIIMYGLMIGLFTYADRTPEQKFDHIKWSADTESRHEMKEDLIKSRLLEGKNKNEVVKIIGEPTRGDTTDVWMYDMGVSGAGFGWAFHELKLTFENEQVVSVEKYEHME